MQILKKKVSFTVILWLKFTALDGGKREREMDIEREKREILL